MKSEANRALVAMTTLTCNLLRVSTENAALIGQLPSSTRQRHDNDTVTTRKRHVNGMRLLRAVSMLILFLTLGVGQMWGWYYSGGKNGWGADAMTTSADGYYEYCRGDYNGQHEFKIRPSNTSWDGALGWGYVTAGFNGTDLLAFSDAGGNIKLEFNSNDPYYILIYPNNTAMNKSGKAIICASRTLPNNSGDATAYFIKPADWTGTISAYEWVQNGGTNARNAAWPGVTASATGDTYDGLLIYSYTTSPKYTNVIYSETGNSWQTGDGLTLFTATTNNSGKMIHQNGIAWEWIDYVKDHVIKSGSTIVWDLGDEPADRWTNTYMYRMHYSAGVEYDAYTKLANNQRYKTYDADTYCSKFLFINNNTPTWTDYRYTTDIEGDPCDVDGITLFTYPNTVTAPKLDWQVTTNAKKATKDVKVYFDNTATSWSNIYLKYGTQWFTRKTSAATKVTGTSNLYYITIPNDTYYKEYFLSKEEGSVGFSNIETMTSITNRTAYQPYHLAADSTLIATTGSGSSPKVWSVSKIAGHTRTVTITAPTNGTITVTYTDESGTSRTQTSGSFEVAQTCILTVSATAATGYSCSALTIGGEAHTSGNTYTVRDDVTIAATFTANTYTVTLDRNNLISPTGSTTATMTYNSSTITDYTAPTKTGYSFGGYWTSETLNDGDGTMVIDDEGVLQENVDGYTGAGGIWIRTTATTLYAKWVELFYRVTFRHNGHGTIAVHGETVANGETAMVLHIITRSLEATPNPGYHFTGWTVTGDGAAHVTIADPSSASTTIKSSSGNATVTANFAPNVHDITYTAPTNGSYTIKAGDASVVSASISDVDYATTITLAATPANACYAFTEWTVTGATPADASAATTTFTMPDNDVTVAASFSQIDLAHNKTVYSGWSRTVIEANAGEIPSKAVDGDLSSQHIQWAINDNFATKGWWGVDLGDNYVLSDVYIYWQAGEDGRAPRNYEIQAAISTPTDFSNDHAMDDVTNWHTIKTISGVAQNLGSTPNIISFTIGEYATARYIRIVNKDSNRKPMAISEFKVYGVATENCYAANTPNASFAGIEGGRIKLNLSATNTNGETLTNFAVLYDGVYYDVTASAGVGYIILPSRRNITARIYAYNKCMQKSSGYAEVEIGDYVNPLENLAELKTTWVSYTNNNNDEKQANLNDGILDTNGWIPYQNTGKNAWMVVDLGDTYQISTIQTFFATGRRSTNYKIYGRQEDPSTDDVRGDNTQWVELASKSSSINAGATESDVNESSVSFTGAIRYVRFESFAEEWDDVANGFKILEFRVFGSAFKSRDLTGPVISTCEIDGSAENETSTVLHLVATDAVDGEVFNYEISTDGGSSWTKYSTDPSTRLVTISGLTSGSYTFTVRAYDIVGNYSSTRTVAVDIWDPDANLALNKTSWAGHETGGAGEAKDKANDGSLTTFWTSWAGANPGDDWWCVDLGDYYQLSEIDVFWHQITDGSINLHSEKYTIRARQTLTGTSSEMEAIMRDSTQWYLIARQSTTPNVGNTESDKNAYALNTPARYILLKSTQRNALNQQIRLSELRAYGSGFADADTHVPVITTATASYNDDGKAYLTLTATDEEDGTTNWFRIYNPYTETYSLQQTNGSNQIVIDGLPTCTNFTFRIQAMDKAAQLSAITNLTVNVPLISTDNIASSATLTSGTNNGAGLNNLIDGNTANTWEVAGGTVAGVDEWLTFQLDDTYMITTVKVYWENHAGGATRPKDYEWQVSNDGIHYAPVLHYTTKPGAEETYTLNATAQYVRLFVNKHDAYNGMCLREVEIHGACAVDTDLPVMLFAEPVEDKIFKTNATIYVGAIHKTIPSDELLYHVNINNGARELTVSAASVTNNQFTISGLAAETAYNVKIWAAKTSDIAGNRSANYKEVNFTTQGDYSSYYLANSINGWLGVNSGVWTDAMNEWRFRTTAVDGIYNLTHTVSVTENWTYLIYDRTHSTRTSGDHTISVTSGKDFIITMKGLEEYISNSHTIYIAGDAVGTTESALTYALTWTDGTHASWEGHVTPGETFRLIFPDQGAPGNLRTNVLTPSAVEYSGSASYAKLTFDLDTWEYEWETAGTFIFDNSSGDGKWSTASNWLNNAVPAIDNDVILQAPVEVDITTAQAKSIVIDQYSGSTGQLIIAAGKELVVAGTVQKKNAGGTLVATEVNDIFIGSSSAGNGALVIGSHDGTNKARVLLYTKTNGVKDQNTSVAQYLGTPFNNETNILHNWYNSWIYGITYNGSNSIDWVRINEGEGMTPFRGYCVYSADGAGHIYDMEGTLNATSNVTCSGLNWQSGVGSANVNNENLLANSWTAPIRINAFVAGDFVKTDATVYIFNATSNSAYVDVAGNYTAYTPGTAGENDVIPSMQSFSVFTNASGGSSVTLDYERLVYNPAVAGTAPITPNYAPNRKMSAEATDKMHLYVSGTSGYSDMLYLLENEDFQTGFENGWDGRKLFGEGAAPQLYALTPDGMMTINCVPTWEGAVLGFRKGTEDNAYAFTFDYEGEGTWYLNDLKEEASTLISSENTYTFTTAANDSELRFVISATPLLNTPTGVNNAAAGNEVYKIIHNDHVYIIRQGRIFDVTGVMVR